MTRPSLGEFDLINRCFRSGFPTSPDTLTGIGDDASVVRPPVDHTLVQSLDTQVADVHFPAQAPADLIAQRALRCAVSDLAAMGATAQGFFLGLTLPKGETISGITRINWLDAFASGLRDAAHQSGIALLGGDTTSGQQLVISCMVQGWVPGNESALLRSGAQPGDEVWVSGPIGRGALALPLVLKNPSYSQGFAQQYYFPEPRLQLGQALRGIATAAMDISDGLIQDAGHIARASQVRIQLQGEAIPTAVGLGHPEWLTCLTGGDDYELLFTAPASRHSDIEALARRLSLTSSCIGVCLAVADQNPENTQSPPQNTVELLLEDRPLSLIQTGFQHF